MIQDKLAKSLVAVLNEGSFQGAARALNVTPAAVTQRIKLLEAQIGARVLVRGKQLRLTPQGQAIVAFHHKNERLQEELLQALDLDAQRYQGKQRWRTLRVAVNADSVASWFMPGVTKTLIKQHLLLDAVIDDQDHTHESLRTGEVMGCVTTLAQPMPGCLAEPLGVMRYRALAIPTLIERMRDVNGQVSIHRLLSEPAVIFNRKDAIHDRFLSEHFDLQSPIYPRHFVPAMDAFETAIALGLGWGLVPDMDPWQVGKQGVALQEVVPGCCLDVQLYWQHWEQEAAAAAALTQAVKAAAKVGLQQRGL